jgi:ankyrin repeat protein
MSKMKKLLIVLLFIISSIGYSQNSSTELIDAITSKNTEKVQQLVNSGTNIHTKDIFENTPLHKAVEQGNIDIVSFLIAQSADVNAKNKSGFTPAYNAVKFDKHNVLQLLIDNGAKVNEQFLNDNGNSLLHLAVKKNHLECAKILLQHNGNVKAVDYNNNKPIYYAKENNNQQMVELLKGKKWAK